MQRWCGKSPSPWVLPRLEALGPAPHTAVSQPALLLALPWELEGGWRWVGSPLLVRVWVLIRA